jgi:hypothetical protein
MMSSSIDVCNEPDPISGLSQKRAQAKVIFLLFPFLRTWMLRSNSNSGTVRSMLTERMRSYCSGRTGTLLSSEVVSSVFVGARPAKAFNYLPAEQLGTIPSLPRQRQVMFGSSNDAIPVQLLQP